MIVDPPATAAAALPAWASKSLADAIGTEDVFEPSGGEGWSRKVTYETTEGSVAPFPGYVLGAKAITAHLDALEALANLASQTQAPSSQALSTAFRAATTTLDAARKDLTDFAKLTKNPYAESAAQQDEKINEIYWVYSYSASQTPNTSALDAERKHLGDSRVASALELLDRYGPDAWADAAGPVRNAATGARAQFSTALDSGLASGIVLTSDREHEWRGASTGGYPEVF